MKYLLGAVLFLAATAMPFVSIAQSASSSEVKLQAIQKIVEEYHKSGEKLSDPDVRKSLMAEIEKVVPVEPKGPADLRDSATVNAEAAKLVAVKYPEAEKDIAKKAEKEAEKLFPLVKEKEKVSIKYRRGDFFYQIDGVYYGCQGNTIKVGDKTVALIDLLPEDKAKFDKVANGELRRDYVLSKTQDHAKLKRVALVEAAIKIHEEQAKRNEKNGYILAWKEWRTAKAVVDMLIAAYPEQKEQAAAAQSTQSAAATPAAAPDSAKTVISAAAPAAAVPAVAPEAVPAKLPGAAAPAAQPQAPVAAAPAASSSKDQYYEELKSSIAAKLQTIANSCSGIDADQGYKNILCGLSRKDVGILLGKEGVKLSSQGDTDSFNPAEGSVKTVEFSYVADTLVKVTVWFRFSDQDSALIIRNALLEKYGFSDEQKKAREEEAKLDKAEKAADGKDKGKEKEKKPAEPPMEFCYHWTGSYISGVVFFKANQARTAFDEIKLIKTNPSLIRKLNDESRREKEEAIRKQRSTEKKKLEF